MARSTRTALLLLLLTPAAMACGGAPDPTLTPSPAAAEPAPERSAPSRHTAADVAFMTDMIGHHAQAVRIARWAGTHGASDAVQRLADRIIVGQQDEIAIMARWLRDHGETVPEPDSSHAMAGMDHAMHMPGMLTGEQLAMLDAARGAEFDRLFLTLMIQHHEGALTMVRQLFGSHGAAQDDTVFRIASDVQADQTVEIRRMRSMLDALGR